MKRILIFISKKVKGLFEDRLWLLNFLFVLLAVFASFGLIYRTFFAKKYMDQNIKLNSIYDRNGNLMAYNVTTYQISIDPKKMAYADEIWTQIAHLNISKIDFLEKFYNREVFVLARDLSLEQIQGIKHQSVILTRFTKRAYPLKKNFTTIGVCSLQKGLIKGVEVLATKEEVHLTIDIRMQNILANVLERAQTKLTPQSCFGILINLDGEIVGVHTTKSTGTEDIHDYFNEVFYGLFEYGSTCKILTVFAGFFYKSFDINTVFDTDEGKYIFGKIKYDFEPIPRFSDLYVIISKSSNRGTTAAAKKIGSNLVDFFKLLKLDAPVDLGFTQTPKPKFFKTYKPDEILGMSYGYNFSTNAFNILRAFLTIFSYGKIINPTLIKNDKKNRIIGQIETEKKVFDDLIGLMRVTAQRNAILDKFGCVSKTGTVDRIVNGQYDGHRVNSYIVCAVPGASGQFKYLMLLAILDPEDSKKAGWNLRDMAAEISERIFFL